MELFLNELMMFIYFYVIKKYNLCVYLYIVKLGIKDFFWLKKINLNVVFVGENKMK